MAATEEAYKSWYETASRQRDLLEDKNEQLADYVERIKVLEEYQFRVKNRMGKCKREKGWDNMPYLLNLQFDRLFKEIEAIEAIEAIEDK